MLIFGTSLEYLIANWCDCRRRNRKNTQPPPQQRAAGSIENLAAITRTTCLRFNRTMPRVSSSPFFSSAVESHLHHLPKSIRQEREPTRENGGGVATRTATRCASPDVRVLHSLDKLSLPAAACLHVHARVSFAAMLRSKLARSIPM